MGGWLPFGDALLSSVCKLEVLCSLSCMGVRVDVRARKGVVIEMINTKVRALTTDKSIHRLGTADIGMNLHYTTTLDMHPLDPWLQLKHDDPCMCTYGSFY